MKLLTKTKIENVCSKENPARYMLHYVHYDGEQILKKGGLQYLV